VDVFQEGGGVTLPGPIAGAPSPVPPPHGRVALVSGGNRGLGLHVVRQLAEWGMRVVLGTRSMTHGYAALDQLDDVAGQVAVRQLDITDPVTVARLADWLGRRLGRCDVLVNNAAVLTDGDGDTAGTVDLDVVQRAVATNLVGTWRLTQAIVPLMRAGRYGRIVNISGGVSGFAGAPGSFPAYQVSKSAVNALTRVLAAELAGDGILVNACYPGPLEITYLDREPVGLAASADTPVWLATLPAGGPTGRLYCGQDQIDE
jgi:NAD(P)-dependent dehydrogenase (short-subunit alcohol dehydrogenase family)